ARLYWENGARGSVIVAAAQKTSEISLPVAITVFPEDVYRAPETWARRAYRNLIYFHEVDKGGHFAAWEEPELFASEFRAAFRSLRSSIGAPAALPIPISTCSSRGTAFISSSWSGSSRTPVSSRRYASRLSWATRSRW